MAGDYTVIFRQRRHFGNQPGVFNDIEPGVPFVGAALNFSFDCPNIDSTETAVLMFQSRDVDHSRNVLTINEIDVFGGLPASPNRNTWNGNILLVERHHGLKEFGNTLHVESRTASGASEGDIDDFIIDNLVIEYKTQPFAEGTDVTAQLNAKLAALVKEGGWGGRLLLPQGGPFYLSDTITFQQIAGQELVGHGARATRFVWRGPGDRPAFDFNRCQDCGLGHFSLEVGEHPETRKSVSELTHVANVATAAISTDHGLVVGQIVYVFGADQGAYNGRHEVTRVVDSNRFTYDVRGNPATPATGSISVYEAATLLTAVRFYNSQDVLHGSGTVTGQLSSKNFLEHLFLKLDGQGKDGVQIVWDPILQPDEPDDDKAKDKNDHHRLTKVQIQGYTDSGIVIQGDQSLAHVFAGCIVQGRDTGQIGINTARRHPNDPPGVYRPGSFKVYGGTIMENQVADLYLTRESNGPIVVNGVHSEGSARLLDMPTFTQDSQLIDRTHIELTGIKHHVPTPPADGECIRYFGNGPLIVSACDLGKQSDDAPYRIRFQPRQGVNMGFICHATVSSQDRRALFTAQLPSNYDAAYRHIGDNENRALIDVVDGNPPRQKPVTEADWFRVLGIVPRCWYRFGETAVSSSTGSDGSIYDCNRRLRPINMQSNAAPLYRQGRDGFDEEWAQFTSATINQQFYLIDPGPAAHSEIDPRVHSVAFLIHHGAVTVTADNEYLCALGSGQTGPGGGPSVWFTTQGLMHATIDNVTQSGSYNYRAPRRLPYRRRL